ncbi:hypothetical protein [Frankia sp. Cj3]|uniref:hypothetical protein n=1 Tax=Frankia sp. Cj3 TaxID=2880976 RepID=UPI001EF7145D|nr:hypothetical protein [Frankia sp. Cj3]
MTPSTPTAPDADSSPPSNALARLIEKRKADLGLSYDEISARSSVAGGPVIPKSTIHRWATREPQRNPPRRLMVALAYALDVRVDVVRDAFAEALGLTRESAGESFSSPVQDVADRIEALPPEEQGRVLWAVECLLAGVDGMARRRHAARSVADPCDPYEVMGDLYEAIRDCSPEQRVRLRAALAVDEDSVTEAPC